MDPSVLKPFHGHQTSFIPFSSGYYLYLASWDSTPSDFTSFSNLWMITPQDRRLLFADPSASSKIACIYHEFHEVYGASISLDWASENQLRIRCASDTGEHELNMELRLQGTTLSRLVVSLSPSRPTRFVVSRPMVALTNLIVNSLVTKGGTTLFGKTETGQPFYAGVTERLIPIRGGSAAMNGRDLGVVSSPTWPLKFGDFVPSGQPVIRLGTLYIPYHEDLPGSA